MKYELDPDEFPASRPTKQQRRKSRAKSRTKKAKKGKFGKRKKKEWVDGRWEEVEVQITEMQLWLPITGTSDDLANWREWQKYRAHQYADSPEDEAELLELMKLLDGEGEG